jgi:hypothetical protein
MKLKIDISSFEWWFWTITLVFIIAALSGWAPGYTVVIMISLIQMIFIGVRTGNATSFPSQVRVVYFAYTLLGLWPAGRFYCYALLAAGTIMVVLFDRCGIALVLKVMPWNKAAENPQCKLAAK